MKFSSVDVLILVDGYDLTPALAQSILPSNENLTEQSNGFGSGAEGHSPTGITRGSLVVGSGFYDKTVDPLHAGTDAAGGVGTLRTVVVCQQGQTVGAPFTGYEGVYSQKSDIQDKVAGLTMANVAYVVDGQVDEGVIVQPRATKVADWDTHLTPVDAADDPAAKHIDIVSSSVESGATSIITTEDAHGLVTGDVVAIFDHASVTPDINDDAVAEAWTEIGHTVTVLSPTTFSIPVDVTDAGTGGYCVLVSHAGGGYGYQQVLDGASLSAFVGTIKHSVDGSTWATLVTFTDTAADYHDGQRVPTALPTTQVRRYLAYYGDGTGFGSINVFAGFSRG